MEDNNKTGSNNKREKTELLVPKRKSQRTVHIGPMFTSAKSVGDKVKTKSNTDAKNQKIINGNNGSLSIQRKALQIDIDAAASNKDYYKAHELHEKLSKLDKKIENSNKSKLQGGTKSNSNKSKLKGGTKSKAAKNSKMVKPQSEGKLFKLKEKVEQLSVQRAAIQSEIDSALLGNQFMKAQGLDVKLGKIDKQLANVNKNISQETMKKAKPKVKMLKELKQVKTVISKETGSVSSIDCPEMAHDPILDVKDMPARSWPRCQVSGEDDAVAGPSSTTASTTSITEIEHTVNSSSQIDAAPRVEAGAKLYQPSYMDQMNKKKEESGQLVKLLESKVLSANNNTKLWAEKRISKMGHLTRMDNFEQSPTTNEYMTRCEFAIGVNPQKENLVVGFQVEPGTTNSPVTSVEHLKHVPSEMKILAELLGKHLSDPGYETHNTVEERGVWISAVVTVTRTKEIMLILNFNPSNLSKLAITNMKIGLKEFFTRGEGAMCNIASLYVCEKRGNSIEDLSLLSGTYTITENILGLNHRISPRSFFYSSTKGLEVMLKQIGEILDLHKDSTLLDICCGSGSIGLFLASKVGEVIGVDILEDAVLDARRTANNNNISNVQFIVGSAEDSISNMVKSSIYDDVVAIMDPPIKGLPTKCLQVIRNSPRIKKVMVICSTSEPCLTNLVELTQSTSTTFKGDPFVPVSMSPVDLLPHTTGAIALFMFMRVSAAELINPTMVHVEKVYGVKAAFTFQPKMSGKISPDCMRRNTIKPNIPAKAEVNRKALSQQVISKSTSPVSEAPLFQLKNSDPGLSFIHEKKKQREGTFPTILSTMSPPIKVSPLKEKALTSTNESTIKEITLKSYHPSLKERQSGVISALYGIQDLQCQTCGLRYSRGDMATYTAHINWHFMIKRKEDNVGKSESRRWYSNTTILLEDTVCTDEESEEDNFGMGARDEKRLIKDQFDRSSKQDNGENIEDGQRYRYNYINVEDSVSHLERYMDHHKKKNLSEMSESTHMDNNARLEGVGLSATCKVQSPQSDQTSDSEDDIYDADFMTECASKVKQNWSKIPSDRKELESYANNEDYEKTGQGSGSFCIKSSRPLIIDKCNQIPLTKSASSDSLIDLDIAAPSRKLMKLSQNGTVDKLFEHPGRKINPVSSSHFQESCMRSEQPSPDQQTRKINVDKIKVFNVQKPGFKRKGLNPQFLNTPQVFNFQKPGFKRKEFNPKFLNTPDDESHDNVTKKTRLASIHDQASPASVIREDNETENDRSEAITNDNLGGITLSDSPMDGEVGNQNNGDISGQNFQAVTSDILDMEEEGADGGVLQKVKKIQSKFCCPKCNCRFRSLVRLENHDQMIHVPIPCAVPGCNKLISRKKMDRHLETHSQTREKFPCSMCNSVFNRSDNLRGHIKKCH